jgi:predicted permease
MREFFVGAVREPLSLVFGAACLVLLVACANVAAMLMARALARQPETAIRAVMGASRGRLIRHVMTESVLLALGGCILGICVAVWMVPTVVALAGTAVPETAQISVDGRLLAGAVALAVFAGLVSGLAPALRAGRALPGMSLRGRHMGVTAGSRGVRTGETFCVAQIALTLVLLVCAGVLTRSFIRLVHVDHGYDPARVAFADLRLPKGFAAEKRLAWSRVALDRVRAIPGVDVAGVSNSVPLNGGAFTTVVAPDAPPGTVGTTWWVAAVDQDYLRVFTIPLKRGTWFGAAPGPTDAVLSTNAAREYFGGADPLGRDVTVHGTTYTVVGVVADMRQSGPALPPPPVLYTAFSNDPSGPTRISIRTAGDPAALVEPLRQALLSVDRTVPIDRVQPMMAMISASIASTELYVWLLGAFSAIALIMAAAGIYGVVSHAVARRTREIGIRMALGAERHAVQSLIVGRGAALLTVGLGVGLAGTFVTTRLLRKFLFEVSPMDPVAVAVVAVLLAVTVLLASYIPARRAAKVDPMIALRQE